MRPPRAGPRLPVRLAQLTRAATDSISEDLGAEARRRYISWVLVQLLYFPGCPHVDDARHSLQQALSVLEHPPEITELDITDPKTPEHLRGWGSPTILIDGADVALGAPSGPSCRLYAGSQSPGVPPLALIEAALRR